MLTDTKSGSMRIALQQIYVNCYVEYVVKNPLSPAEHPGGLGVNNELFEASLEQFVVWRILDAGSLHMLTLDPGPSSERSLNYSKSQDRAGSLTPAEQPIRMLMA